MTKLIANNASKGMTTSIAMAVGMLMEKYPGQVKLVSGSLVGGEDFSAEFEIGGKVFGFMSDAEPDDGLREMGCDLFICATSAHGEMKYEAAVMTKYGTDVVWAANPMVYDERIAESINIRYAEFIVKLVETNSKFGI